MKNLRYPDGSLNRGAIDHEKVSAKTGIDRTFDNVSSLFDRVISNNWNDRAVGRLSDSSDRYQDSEDGSAQADGEAQTERKCQTGDSE